MGFEDWNNLGKTETLYHVSNKKARFVPQGHDVH